MDVKRDRGGLAYDIAQMLNALEVRQQICSRFSNSCYRCPLGKLGVLDTRTCLDIDKLVKRLELIYRVVEQ